MAKLVYNLAEAKTELSRLVGRAATGEEIIIAKAGKPLAKLVPIAGAAKKRQPGGWEGRVVIAEDFDEPLPGECRPPLKVARETTAEQCSAGARGSIWT